MAAYHPTELHEDEHNYGGLAPKDRAAETPFCEIPPATQDLAVPDIDFRVLVASANPAELARIKVPYDGIACHDDDALWTLVRLDDVPDGDFDLSIVVCGDAVELPVAMSVAAALVRRRDTTILLVPAVIARADTKVDGALVVSARGTDSLSNLTLLAHVVVAPVVTESIVCVDWADILSVLDDGDRATLVGGAGSSPPEAVGEFLTKFRAIPGPPFHSVCAAVSSEHGMTMKAYHSLLDALTAGTASDAFRILTVPEHLGRGAAASALVITSPVRRGRISRLGPFESTDLDDIPGFLKKQV